MLKKVKYNFINIFLILAMVLSTLPMATITTVAQDQNLAQPEDITDENGVILSKKATPVAGKLNEWEVELGVSLKSDPVSHDIVLIIDTSGSMKNFNRMTNARDAAKSFVNTVLSDEVPHDSRIALVSYSTYFQVNQPFTNDKVGLINSINKLKADGGTFTQAAIKQGRDMLASSTAEKKSMVILTDGAPTFSYGLKKSTFDKLDENSISDKTQVGTSTNNQIYRVDDKGNFKNQNKPSSFVYRNSFYINDNLYDTMDENHFEYNTNGIDYYDMMGGHGSEASRYIGHKSGYHFFLNLYKITLLEAQFAKDQGIEIHTVGLGLKGDEQALNMLENMATTEDKYYSVDDDSEELSNVFKTIAEELGFTYFDIELSDPMGEYVDLVGPVETIVGNDSGLVSADDLITWKMKPSNFKYDKETDRYSFKIRYRVKTNDKALEIVDGEVSKIDTNGDAGFQYTKDSTPNKEEFPKPSVQPTILAVRKVLYDYSGTDVSLTDEHEEIQRSYNFSIENKQEKHDGIIYHDTDKRYFIPTEPGIWSIKETSIENDVLERFDITYTDGAGNPLKDGEFELTNDSFVEEVVIHNTPKNDYQSDYSVAKEVTDENNNQLAEYGETLTYKIKVNNNAEDIIRDIQIKDDLQKLSKYLKDGYKQNKVLISRNGNFEENITLQELIDGYPTYLQGKDELTLEFDVNVLDDGKQKLPEQLVNTVVVSQNNQEKTADTSINTGVPKIIAKKTVVDENNDGVASAGENLIYTIEIKNEGEVEKKDLFVQDTLGNLVDHIEDTSDVVFDLQGTEYTLAELQEGFNIDLGAGKEAAIVFTVKVKEDLDATEVTSLSNLATIGEEEPSVEIPTGEAKIDASKEVKDSNGDDYAEAGEILNYTIKVINSGTAKKNDLFIKDELAEIKDYVELIDKNVIVKGTNSTRTFKMDELMEGFHVDIAAKETLTIEFKVKVIDDFNSDDVPILHNIATVGEEDVYAEIKTGKPIIKADKSVIEENKDGYASAGEKLTYVIEVKNEGKVAIENLEIQDDLTQLENYVDFIDETVLVENKAGEIDRFTLTDLMSGIKVNLAANETLNVRFSVKVKDDLDFGENTKIVNLATVGEENPSVEIPIGNPDIKVNKSVVDENGDGIAEAGEKLTYTINIANKGEVEKTDLFVQDTLGNLVDHIEDTSDVVFDLQGTEYTLAELQEGFNIDLDAGDAVSIVFTVKVKEDFDSDAVTSLSNLATIGEETPGVEIPTGKANIISDKSVADENGDGLAEAGEKLTYTITVENNGTVRKNNLVIKDDMSSLKEHVEFKNSTVMMSNAGETSIHSVDELMAGIAVSIDANEKLVLSFTVKVKEDFDSDSISELVNLATIGEQTPSVKIPTGKAVIISDKSVVDENGDGFAEAGEKLTYTINIANKGEVEKTDLFVQDTLGNLVDHIEDISDVVFDLQGTEYTLAELQEGFNIDLDAGKEVAVVFTVKVKEDFDSDAVTSLSNLATIGEETPSVEIPTGSPNLVARKLVSDENKNGYAELGEKLTYSIYVKNTGEVAQNSVIIKDSLDQLLPYIVDPSDVTFTVNGVVYSISDLMSGIEVDLGVGESVTISFVIQIKDTFDAKHIDKLTNTAYVDEEGITVEIPMKYPEMPKEDKPLPSTGMSNNTLYLSLFMVIMGSLIVLLDKRKEHEEN